MTASIHSFPTVRQLGIRQRSLRRHCRLGRATELVFILATGATLVVAGGAEAQTWDGQTNTNWDNATNWNPDGVPGAAATVTISGAGGVNQPTVNANQTVDLTNVTAGTLTVAATLTSNVVVSGTGTMTINSGNSVVGSVQADPASGTINNNGTISGSLIVNGGTVNNAGAVTGPTSVNSGTLNLNSGTNLADAQALTVNGGTVNVNASDTVGRLSGTGGTIAIAGGSVLHVEQSAAGTFAGGMSGDIGFNSTYFEKLGAGTLTLSGTSSVTGAGRMEITSGTLQVSGGNAIGNNTIIGIGAATLELLSDETVGALANDAAATVNLNGNTLTLAGVGGAASVSPGGNITGTGNLVYAATDLTTTFLNAFTYTGDTTISAGIFRLGINNLIDDASDLVVSGGTLAMQGFSDTVNTVTLSSGGITNTGTLTVTGTYDQSGGTLGSGLTVSAGGDKTLSGGTIAGTLGGAGATTVEGGTVTVTGTIDSDVTVASGGTLRLGSSNAVSGSITTTGSVVSYANGVNEASPLIISSATTQLEVQGTDAATQSGVISSTGAFGFEKIGTGNLTVSGTNTYTGVTTVSAGTLTITNGSALGTTAGGTTVASGATLAVSGGITSAEGLTLNGIGASGGGALRNVAGNNTMSGNISLASASRITSDAGNLTLSGIISGSSNLTKDGAGTVTLEAANTYTGSTIVNGGMLDITGSVASASITANNAGVLRVDGASLSDTAAVVLNDTSNLTLTGNETIGSLNGAAGATVTLGANTLTTGGNNGSTTFAGAIDGTGGLTKEGTGSFTLSGANTYTGTTTVNAGTLVLQGGSAIDDGSALHIGAAGTVTSTANDETVGNLSADAGGRLNVGNRVFQTITSADSEFAGTLAGGSSAVFAQVGGAVLTFSGDGSGFTGTFGASGGGIVLTAGATLDASAVGALSGATLTTEGGVLTNADVGLIAEGTINFNGSETVASLTNNDFDGPGTGTININGAATVLTLAGGSRPSAHSGEINGTGALATTGGTHTLSGDIDIGGGVDVGTGSTLVLGGSNAFGGDITVSGTLRLESDNAAGGAAGQIVTQGSVIDYADGVNINTPIEIASNTTQVQVTTGAAEQSGNITEDAAGRPLEKIGDGELLLSGTNSFTGDLTITGGTLAVTGGAAIDDTVEVVVGSGATFRLDSNEDIGALSSAAADSTVDVGANALSIVGAQDTTYAGAMTGTGSVLNDGSGRLELTGDGSGFTGLLGAIGAGSEIALTGGGTTGAAGLGAGFGATFTTDGGAILASDAVVAADGQVTFTGSETVGSIVNSAASGLATGTITLTGAGTTLTINGSANPVNPGGYNGTDGTIDGDGELAITGGTFQVGATGDVQVDTGIAAGATVENSGTMAGVSNEGTFTNNAGASAGALTNTGAGAGSNAGTLASLQHDSTGTFDNSGSVTGDTSISDGTLNLTAGSDLSDSGTLTVTGGEVNVDTAETVGTLDATGGTVTTNADLTAGVLTGASGGSIVTTATGGLIAGNATSSTFGGVISGDGFLQKLGTGTLTLTAANSYTGTTTVDGGTLALTGSGSVASTTIDINAGGTLSTDGGALATAAAVTNQGTFTITGNESIASLDNTGATATNLNGGTLTLNSGASTLATALSGSGGLTVAGTSVTTATAANTFTGATTVNSGGTLNLTGAGAVASTTIDINAGGTLTTDGGALASTAEVDNEGTFTITGDESIASLDNTDATATTLTGATLTLNSGTSALATAVGGTGGVTVAGGTTNVTAAQTYTGATKVTGGAMNLTGSGALASTDVQVTGNGSLTTDGGGLASGATVLVDDTGVLAVNGTETITTLDQQGGFVNGTGTLNTTDFTQTGGGVVSGTVTVSTSTFEQDNGEIQSGAKVTQSTSATLKGGTIAGTLEGAGAVTVETGTTTVTGSITSTDVTVASGELRLDGGEGLADDADLTVNGGLVDVNIDETIATLNGAGGTVNVASGNTLTLGEATADTATYAGSVDGAGNLEKQGTNTQELTGANGLTGSVAVKGGTLKVTGAGTLASTDLQTEAGAALETDGGALDAAAEVTNEGTLRVVGGSETVATINGAGDLELNAGGKLTLTGGTSTIDGTISGDGGLVLDDTADSATDTTFLTLTGDSSAFTGVTDVLAGRLDITSPAILGGAVNVSSGSVLNLEGRVGGTLSNSGTVNVTGSASVGGDMVNSGTVDMTNGATNDVLTVDGGITGSGSYGIDLNLSSGETDRILGTNATATVLNFNLSATGYGYTGGPVLVFSGVAAGATINDGGVLAGIGGAINYGLQQNGDSVYLVSELDSAIGGVAASAALTQSLIGTIINRPTSPFVSGLAAEETCSHGGYFRATSGKANVDGGSTAFGSFTPTSLSSSFWGVQGGYDFGCFDGRFFDGWDGAMGVMLGYNAGSTNQMLFSNLTTPTTATGRLTTDFSQDYIGLYVAGGKDRLSADLQLRYDNTSFDISEIAFGSNAEVGLDGTSYSTKSATLGTRLNYRMDVNEAKGINFVPTVGFNVTRVSGDMITLSGGETLELQSYTTFVGFVGGALTQTKIAEDGTAATTTFISGNYYQDFSGDRTALFDLDGAGGSPAENVSVASIGGFGELSLGLNYVRVLDEGPAGAKQLNASIRADARFGENVSDAYSVTAQVRLSF